MTTLKKLNESLTDIFAKQKADLEKAKPERDRDTEFLHNEFAKHDIAPGKVKHEPHPLRPNTWNTRIEVPSESHDKANELIKKHGLSKTHSVWSSTTLGGRFNDKRNED